MAQTSIAIDPLRTSARRGDAARAVAAEAIGTAFLLAAVVGSGIMGSRLCAGNEAIALLANSIATGAALVALVAAFGPVSGAHFNPVVTLMEAWKGALSPARAGAYVSAQFAGAVTGVAVAHGMFGGAVFRVSTTMRSGPGLLLAEFVATAGLLGVVRGVSAAKSPLAPLAVGGWIAAAYWFTSSTSFANPSVTFAGIRPADAPGFVAAQVAGLVVGALVWARIFPEDARA